MTTLLQPPAPSASAPIIHEGEQHLVLSNVTWEDYLAIGHLFEDRPALRLTYNRGTLEFLTTSSRHERYKRWLGRFIETIAEELNQPLMPGGSMTFQRKNLDRGFEPDDCFWIANEAVVRDRLTWEPTKDPPPDLGLEIEVTRSAVKRMAIFAAFHIPEVWRYDGDVLRVHLLQADGAYQPSDTSLAFPAIPVQELVRFFPPVGNTDYLGAVAAVRAWVRSLIQPST